MEQRSLVLKICLELFRNGMMNTIPSHKYMALMLSHRGQLLFQVGLRSKIM